MPHKCPFGATFETGHTSESFNKSTMKRTILSLIAGTILLTGCLETTQEITLKEDGSGTLSTTSDMSAVLGLAKQMGGGEMEKAAEQVIDTTVLLGSQADSIADLTNEEKELLKKGSMNMKFNLKKDEFRTRLDFPFNNPAEIGVFNKLTGKLLATAMKDQMGSSPMGGGMTGGEMPPFSSFDDYFKLEFSNGELKKKLDKDKYAFASSDEYLTGMKQAASMGIPVGATYIINLPRPAEKVEGKNVKLSEDKMKVTVKVELDDFFDDPEKLEFKIKY